MTAGIICQDDINTVGHSLFSNFRKALSNYFLFSFKNIFNSNDLEDINLLFIVDEHYIPHVPIWKNEEFIYNLNKKNIRTIVFNFEKIFSSSFPWNVDHQKKLESIKNLFQLVSDIEDAELLKKNIINKQLLSKDTALSKVKPDKLNKLLFLGQCNNFYPTRQSLLNKIQSQNLPVDIKITDRKLSYLEFINTLNSYKFCLNPLGTGKFLNLRFYEALHLDCIPVQQITPGMRRWYSELENSITFYDAEDLLNIDFSGIQNNKKNEFFLEDYFKEINLFNLL